MNTPTAVRIDIETELAAIARGACAACRIGARHAPDSACPQAKKWGDLWCARGAHDVPVTFDNGVRVRRGRCKHCGKDVL
jgi:hypothetical protein